MNTIQCNQKCTKCSHWKYKDTAERLPTDRVIKGILSIPSAKELCIVGGEPLLFKEEIYAILEGIASSEIRTILITNGVPMDKAFIHEVSKYNIHIVVSIDTMDKEFWRFVRGTNSYEKVFKNLEYAINYLEGPQISVQSVLSKETAPHIASVGAYAKEKGIYHSIQDYITEGFEGNWTPMEQKEAFVPDAQQQCYAADRNLSIVQNGDVFTCFQQNWMKDCQKPLGNLNTMDMSTILSSEYAQTVSATMRVCDLPCKVLKCNTKH